MNNIQKKIFTVIGVVAVLAFVFWLGQPSGISSQESDSTNSGSSSKGATTLVAADKLYDFGAISMANGNVSRVFKVKNTGAGEVTVNKLYTSCMCTSASITAAAGKKGPFSMPGHGVVPKIDVPIKPDEEFEVEVTFDPTAHGPAGVGRIERQILLENSAGAPLVLNIKANVTP